MKDSSTPGQINTCMDWIKQNSGNQKTIWATVKLNKEKPHMRNVFKGSSLIAKEGCLCPTDS